MLQMEVKNHRSESADDISASDKSVLPRCRYQNRLDSRGYQTEQHYQPVEAQSVFRTPTMRPKCPICQRQIIQQAGNSVLAKANPVPVHLCCRG